MTSFSGIWKDAGVLSGPPPFLVVPWAGLGLVYLNRVRPVEPWRDLKYNRQKLDVSVVQSNQITRHLVPWSQNFPSSAFEDVVGLTSDIHNQLQSRTLLAVKGKVAGETVSLDYVGKAGAAKLDVYTVERTTATVAFRFIHYLDDAGQMKAGTKLDPAYAEELIGIMNRLYMPSANVELTLGTSTAVNVHQRLGAKVHTTSFRQHLVPLRDGNADMTVFFVGQYEGVGRDPLGQALHDVNCIVVDEAPWTYKAPDRDWARPNFTDDEIYHKPLERPKSDRDLHIVLAHEIAHLLGADHNGVEDNIMSDGRQDLKLSKQVVKAIKRS